MDETITEVVTHKVINKSGISEPELVGTPEDGPLVLTREGTYLRRTPIQTDYLLPDYSEVFWRGEQKEKMESVWNSVGKKLEQRFGIVPTAFNTDLFIPTYIPPDRGAYLGSCNVTSGLMLMNLEHIDDLEEGIKTMVHEEGHFYGLRQLQVTSNGKEVQQAVGLWRKSNEKNEKDETLWSLEVFNEAHNEIRMKEILSEVVQELNLESIFDKPISAETYSQAREAYGIFIDNLVLGYNHPEYRYFGDKKLPETTSSWINEIKKQNPEYFTQIDREAVMKLFDLASWGKKGSEPDIRPLQALITEVYGPQGFSALLSASTAIPASNVNKYAHDNGELGEKCKQFWDIITAPEKRRSKDHSESQVQMSFDGLTINIDPSSIPNEVPIFSYRDRFGIVESLKEDLDELALLHKVPIPNVIFEDLLYEASSDISIEKTGAFSVSSLNETSSRMSEKEVNAFKVIDISDDKSITEEEKIKDLTRRTSLSVFRKNLNIPDIPESSEVIEQSETGTKFVVDSYTIPGETAKLVSFKQQGSNIQYWVFK